MKLPPQLPPFNGDFPHIPSRREAHRGVAPELFTASTRRIRYRAVITWSDPSTRSGRREEVREFARPDRLVDLLRRIHAKPDRPLISIRIQARPTPRWSVVTPAFLAWRAADHARREPGGSR